MYDDCESDVPVLVLDLSAYVRTQVAHVSPTVGVGERLVSVPPHSGVVRRASIGESCLQCTVLVDSPDYLAGGALDVNDALCECDLAAVYREPTHEVHVLPLREVL